MATELIEALTKSVTTFVDQTKDVLHGVQTEIQQLKATVDTMAKEMQADREAQIDQGRWRRRQETQQDHRRHWKGDWKITCER